MTIEKIKKKWLRKYGISVYNEGYKDHNGMPESMLIKEFIADLDTLTTNAKLNKDEKK